MFENIIKNVHNRHPLIHCITNYVSINDCANIVLACGGAPIMAEDINEVSQITSICQGLDINIGMLNDNKLSSMLCQIPRSNLSLSNLVWSKGLPNNCLAIKRTSSTKLSRLQ